MNNKIYAIGHKRKGKKIITLTKPCSYKQAWKQWRKLQKRKTSAFLQTLNQLIDSAFIPEFKNLWEEASNINLTLDLHSTFTQNIAHKIPIGILKKQGDNE